MKAQREAQIVEATAASGGVADCLGYGIGERMSLNYTRAMVNACIAGELDDVPVEPHPVFRVLVPKSAPGVPSELLDARAQWSDKAGYDRAAEALSALFKKNFEKFGKVSEEIMEAAPA